mgnify:CR=1 FL=1
MKIEQKEEIIEVKDSKPASETKNTNMLIAAFMIFIFPIISIFIGVFIGGYIGKFIGASIEISQIIGGIITFMLAVLIIKLFDKSAKVDKNIEKIYWGDL